MGCVLPGAFDPVSLWKLVEKGQCAISTVPDGYWGLDPGTVLSATPPDFSAPFPERTVTDKGGYVTGFDAVFDPTGFQLPEEIIRGSDPALWWLLHSARQALGECRIDALPQKTGLIIGNLAYPTTQFVRYAESIWLDQEIEKKAHHRFTAGSLAGQVAKALGANGLFFALDAACASSLYALHFACHQLREGRADLMLVGAANHADDLFLHMGFTALQALSPSGQSRPFHRDADGLIPAEGAAVVVLQRLSEAIEAKRPVLGVIRHIGLSNDGRGKGLLAPDEQGQIRAMETAYKASGIDPAQVSLVECHATGTVLGDGVELASMAKIFGARKTPLILSSSKANMGHLITASGLAGLLKVLAALSHKRFPPTPNAYPLSPVIEHGPFTVLEKPTPWESDERPRLAAINNFGFGGNNAHLILEEWIDDANQVIPPPVSGNPSSEIVIVGVGLAVGDQKNTVEVVRALFEHKPTLSPSRQAKVIEHPLNDLGFPPSDLKQALPQQLFLMQAVREAVSHPKKRDPDRAGILIGMECDPEITRFGLQWHYPDIFGKESDNAILELTSAGVLGCMPNILANRLNSLFDLRGMGLTIAQEAESGIDALQVALEALRRGDLDVAVVGAVEMATNPIHERAMVGCFPHLPRQGSDAAVALVLKRMEDAEQDGDTIVARLHMPETGSSTASSDKISTDAWAREPVIDRFGFPHAADALLHVTLGALAVSGRALPGPSNHGASPRSFSGKNSDLRVSSSAGTTVTLSSHPNSSPRAVGPEPIFLYCYSGADRDDLKENLRQDKPSTHGPRRIVIQSKTPEMLQFRRKAAINLVDGQEYAAYPIELGKGIFFCDATVTGETAFIFTGAAGTYAGMGRELLLALPSLWGAGKNRNIYPGEKILESIHGEDDQRQINPAEQLVASSFLCQLHATLTLDFLGLEPQATLGISSGESNALLALGAWEDTSIIDEITSSEIYGHLLTGDCRAAAESWSLSKDEIVHWKNWHLFAPLEEVRHQVAKEPRVHITIIQSPTECVIGGEEGACRRVVKRVGSTWARHLGLDMVVHCPEFRVSAQPWRRLHHRRTHSVPGVRFYRNDTGRAYHPDSDSAADAITGQAGDTVDFPRTVLRAWEDGVRIFVEHGPGNGLTRAVGEILDGRPHLAVSLDRRGKCAMAQAMETAAMLTAAGQSVDIDKINDAFAEVNAWRLSSQEIQKARTIAFPAHWPPVPSRQNASWPEKGDLKSDKQTEQISAPALAPPTWELPENAPIRPIGEVRQIPAPHLHPVTSSPLGKSPLDEIGPETVEHYISTGSDTVHTSMKSRRSSNGKGIDEVPSGNFPAHEITSKVPMPHTVADLPLYPNDPVGNIIRVHRNYLRLHRRFLAQQSALLDMYRRTRGKTPSKNIGVPETIPEDFPHSPPADPSRTATTTNPPDNILPDWLSASDSPSVPDNQTIETASQEADPDEEIQHRPIGSHVRFTRQELEELAGGCISSVFGPLFEKQDQYVRQVRMPEPPLLLADRVMEITGEPGSMGRGSVVTETDVRVDSWYLHQGVMPPGIVIESGQADLLLISWLGIDFLNRGERIYRLLGCELTFHHSGLPRPGETLRFDIHVDGHARQGDIRLFFFHYDCRIGDELRLSVRSGQAGFFNDEELASSGGVLWSAEEDQAATDFRLDPAPGPTTKRCFSAEEVKSFVQGNPWRCFGEGFRMTAAHQRTPTIPGGRMQLLEEITAFDPEGGPWGRGYLRAETQVNPDDWYFDGHFKNDPCMPGTLMADAALQTMAFYMAALGFTLDRDGWRFEPVTEEPYTFVCRGQVTPKNRHLTYELFVESVEDGPEPRLFGALLCHCDGLKVFHCRRFGLTLVPDWPLAERHHLLVENESPHYVGTDKRVPGNHAALLACAWGKPSEAFGQMYQQFDGPHRLPRLPGPPYHFITHIVSVSTPSGQPEKGGCLTTVYDIPSNAWYFQENNYSAMPFCVLLEAMLQPCGWYASYMGFVTRNPKSFVFRNLDGDKLILYRELTPDSGTLRIKVDFTDFSLMRSMTLVSFHVESFLGNEPVFSFDTSFGFFTTQSMEGQTGLAAPEAERRLFSNPGRLHVDLSKTPSRFFSNLARLPDSRLRMIDEITDFQAAGGKTSLGFLRTRQQIDPEAWYFKAHFFQDPVQAGSLGIEAMLQALQCLMLLKDLDKEVPGGRFQTATGKQPMSWKYRGQVLPTNREVVITMHLVHVERGKEGILATGEGALWVDGLCIYQAAGLGMRIVSSAREISVYPESLEQDDRESNIWKSKEAVRSGSGLDQKAIKEGTLKKDSHNNQWILDRENAPWLWDHCPTHTVPAMPMMGFVDSMAQAASEYAHGNVTEIRDARAFRWACPDQSGILALSWEVRPTPGYEHQEGKIALSVVIRAGENTIARSTVILDRKPEPPPRFSIEGPMAPVPFPYDHLFHGPTFQVLLELKRGPNGAKAFLDAKPKAGMPVGVLHPILLDGATHAIPHDTLEQWFTNIVPGNVGYPNYIPWLRCYGPPPMTGSIRCLVKPLVSKTGNASPSNTMQFLIRLDYPDGTPWVAMELHEFLFPLGPIGTKTHRERRAFLRDRRFVPGMCLSLISKGETRLSQDEVTASNWLPGTLETVYDNWKPLPELLDAIAVKEHLANQTALHPSFFDFDGQAIASPHLPFNTIRPVVEKTAGQVMVADGSESLDTNIASAWWQDYLGYTDPWPGEILLLALARRFVRRVIVTDPEGLAACRGKPVIFLANHQVGIESILFNMLTPGLIEVPIMAMAKAEHRHSWMGRLLSLLESWPAFEFPPLVFFFDRSKRGNLVSELPALQTRLNRNKYALLVHAEGTRSLTCNVPVTQSSAIFPDLALSMGIPIIPVRFSGGLPTKESNNQTRLELPMGLTAQDWFIGSPLYPEELSKMSLKARKGRILAAMNNLGPPLESETPNPPNEALSEEIQKLVTSLGIWPLAATFLTTMQLDPEAVSLAESLLAGNPINGSPSDGWLSDFKQWIMNL